MDYKAELTFAQRARKFIRDLFGSRLVEHLEAELFRQQSFYEQRLLERDQTIAELRQEALRLQAKFSEYELDPTYFWWLAQRGRTPVPANSDSHSFSEVPVSTWQQIQDEWYKRQEESSKESPNGVQNSGRNEELRVEVPG